MILPITSRNFQAMSVRNKEDTAAWLQMWLQSRSSQKQLLNFGDLDIGSTSQCPPAATVSRRHTQPTLQSVSLESGPFLTEALRDAQSGLWSRVVCRGLPSERYNQQITSAVFTANGRTNQSLCTLLLDSKRMLFDEISAATNSRRYTLDPIGNIRIIGRIG